MKGLRIWLMLPVLLLSGFNASAAYEECSLSDISIKSFKVNVVKYKWGDIDLKGAGTLLNKCNTPVGVQLKLSAYDSAGNAVLVDDFWPASINNIPPGEYDFSILSGTDGNEDMKTFKLIPISVKKWGS
ncbi:hypothetical protein GPY51_21980 [Photorhabdus laumondii subsp. laumondii]|uniref:Spore coat protein U domain-containing protein n=1 Tax=Photorhabdus laumondii subsp. laumondii TaxID=141679 RepID=A0A6L9JU93_PHOLM|nr:hypothetical protein [Photorhabdus laumondii]MCC8385320.1 hypothetical protein [Photorhabdus laumondii]MCC8414086.1 hypothetical protein [Photorhabdus laumondii]NDK96979.1 hypothetical protein [Photorhabdus laumondii subsp. laumondii]NDL23192.1 hypothetical protein [Photorhabdus laumondii subsp. laumondii]NDL32173.1 hypothetical protein [Photorhabdus laumondii subsp. laumondii]